MHWVLWRPASSAGGQRANNAVAIDAFPSSAAFDAISDALKASKPDRDNAIKDGKAVFAFNLKNKAGETESWHIDLKEKGEVGKGLGTKPTGKITRLTSPGQ